MLVAYVSGKYRDARGPWYVKQNVHAAEGVALELWQLGLAVICPHKNTEFLEGPLDDPMIIAGDIEFVRRSDLIVMAPNWKTSIGSKIEMRTAVFEDKPVFFWPQDQTLIKTFISRPEDIEDVLSRRKDEHAELVKSFEEDIKVQEVLS
jgi:hypothetical protein